MDEKKLNIENAELTDEALDEVAGGRSTRVTIGKPVMPKVGEISTGPIANTQIGTGATQIAAGATQVAAGATQIAAGATQGAAGATQGAAGATQSVNDILGFNNTSTI